MKNVECKIMLIIVLAALPIYARAAEFYFGSQSQELPFGKLVEVGVFLNTNAKQVNAVEGRILYPEDVLSLREIRTGNSSINFWIEYPKRAAVCEGGEDNGDGGGDGLCDVAFSGVTPGGFVGPNMYLFSMIFETRKATPGVIESTDEQVLLHDGKGTPDSVSRAPLRFTIVEQLGALDFSSSDDTEPPETFTPEIVRDANFFEGRWTLVFATQDKGTGVDHFEIAERREVKIGSMAFGRGTKQWQRSESPYVLNDQARRSTVYVRAIDRSGNARVAIVSPRYPRPWYTTPEIWSILIGVAAVLYFARKKYGRKKYIIGK